MKEKIVRKDGFSYERKRREKVYDTYLQIRINKNIKERLDLVAKKQGIKTNKLVRELIEGYINISE